LPNEVADGHFNICAAPCVGDKSAAMKEDILEQLVDDYLQAKGYFTLGNLKFKPDPSHPAFDARQDCVYSDIDVVGYNPKLPEPDRVWVVTCKSWQGGFDVNLILNAITQNKRLFGKDAWKYFRELRVPKWTDAFLRAIQQATGTRRFTYVTAATAFSHADAEMRQAWVQNPEFVAALEGNPLKLLSFSEMIEEVFDRLGTAVAPTQFSRTLQLMKASGWQIQLRNIPKTKPSETPEPQT
jgi:hypothetical protein